MELRVISEGSSVKDWAGLTVNILNEISLEAYLIYYKLLFDYMVFLVKLERWGVGAAVHIK